jgi:hypothetical protein
MLFGIPKYDFEVILEHKRLGLRKNADKNVLIGI